MAAEATESEGELVSLSHGDEEFQVPKELLEDVSRIRGVH